MNTQIRNSLLWLAIFPASLISSILAYGLWRIIQYIALTSYVEPSSWVYIFYVEITSNFIAGAALVYTGSKIAPTYTKKVAIVLTVIALLFGGASVFIVNFITRDFIANIGIIAGLTGSIVTCIEIDRGNIDKLV